MKRYEITLTNKRKTTINEHMFDLMINKPYVSKISLIRDTYDINEIANFMLKNSEIISDNGIFFYCRLKRPCDTIYFEIYKYTENEWCSTIKYSVERAKGKSALKTICDINVFYETFFKDLDKYNQSDKRMVSTNYINKLKKICFYNKKGIKAYFDVNGNIYYCYKAEIPTKKSKEEYKRFHNKPRCVLIGYNIGIHNRKEWFESIEDANKFVSENGITTWYVEKYRYTRCSPESRKIYFQLPYYNILQEVADEKEVHKVAWRWSSASDGDYGTILILVEEYIKFFVQNEELRIKMLSELPSD